MAANISELTLEMSILLGKGVAGAGDPKQKKLAVWLVCPTKTQLSMHSLLRVFVVCMMKHLHPWLSKMLSVKTLINLSKRAG